MMLHHAGYHMALWSDFVNRKYIENMLIEVGISHWEIPRTITRLIILLHENRDSRR